MGQSMKKLYQTNSYAESVSTKSIGLAIMKKRTAVAVEDLIFHPKGGGQPDDKGYIIIRDEKFRLNRLIKQGRHVFCQLEQRVDFHNDMEQGETVECVLDWKYRFLSMRYHTAAHVFMAMTRAVLPDFVPHGIEIKDDHSRCSIYFRSARDAPSNDGIEITKSVERVVTENRKVYEVFYKNLETAQVEHGDLFRVNPDILFSGEIRTIVIEGVDANPCGGTHVQQTGEIGKLVEVSCDDSSLSFSLKNSVE